MIIVLSAISVIVPWSTSIRAARAPTSWWMVFDLHSPNPLNGGTSCANRKWRHGVMWYDTALFTGHENRFSPPLFPLFHSAVRCPIQKRHCVVAFINWREPEHGYKFRADIMESAICFRADTLRSQARFWDIDQTNMLSGMNEITFSDHREGGDVDKKGSTCALENRGLISCRFTQPERTRNWAVQASRISSYLHPSFRGIVTWRQRHVYRPFEVYQLYLIFVQILLLRSVWKHPGISSIKLFIKQNYQVIL
jgi:hypothetical protein